MSIKSCLVSLFLLCTSQAISAQIFGRIVDRAADKISNRIEDKIVEKISDEITKAAFKPVDKAIDDMFREQYEQDSTGGQVAKVDYGEYLNKMLQPVDLPEEYAFDVQIYAETKDYDGDKNEMTILMSSTKDHIGIITEDDGKESMIVFDVETDVMAVYDLQENKVSAFASMMGLAAKAASEQEVTVEKTGKSKKIAGYECEEYLIEDETTTTKAYVSEDFPASWAKAFAKMFQKVSPTSRNQLLDGMALKSESKTKKKNKKTTFEAKKVTREVYTVKNADYEKVQYGKD